MCAEAPVASETLAGRSAIKLPWPNQTPAMGLGVHISCASVTIRFRSSSTSAVRVIQPYDVVLAEITSGLNLDQFERNLAGIGKAMNAADRDVSGFIFVDGPDFGTDRDFRR